MEYDSENEWLRKWGDFFFMQKIYSKINVYFLNQNTAVAFVEVNSFCLKYIKQI